MELSEKETTKISKFLSLILRHKPEAIGIELDENGWADVNLLLEKLTLTALHVDREILNHIVATNPKKRLLLMMRQIKYGQARDIL